MKKYFAELKNKFWFQLFLKVGIIFASFVLLLTLCNSVFLKGYYEYINKQDLKSASAEFDGVDLTDKEIKMMKERIDFLKKEWKLK